MPFVFSALWLGILVAPAAEPDNTRAYVALSDDAAQLIQAGQTAQKNQDWTGAVKNYQEALEKYPDRLVADREHNTYLGVKYFCQQLLAGLPADGKKAYREAFDPSARTLIEMARSTGNTKLLNDTVDRYLYTSYGAQALNLLAMANLEKGEIEEAKHLFETLSDLYGSLEKSDLSLPQILAYRVFCYSRLKQMEELEALGNLVENKYPDWQVSFQGKTISLRDLIRTSLTTLKQQSLTTINDWNTYGGDNNHNRLMGPAIARFPPRAWSYQLPPLRLSLRNTNPLAMPTTLPPEKYFPYFPAVDKGILYLKTETGLYAFNLINLNEDNKEDALWKFEGTYTGELIYEERILLPVTVADNKVYANLVTAVSGGDRREVFRGFDLDVKFPMPQRSLFVFSNANGKIIWTAGGQENAREFLKKVSFPMPPVADHNVLYAAAVYTENESDLPQQYLCAFNATTGELYWKTFITSGLLEVNLFNNPSREIIGSMITLDNENIYYSTNLGIIAAVDQRSGMIKWLNKYQQYEIPPTRTEFPPHLPLGWVNNPLIKVPLSSNRSVVVTAPIDSPFLYAFDAQTGAELWKWDGSDLGPVRYVIGCQNDKIYLQGSNAAMCLDLAKQGKREWLRPGPFLGKGALTGQALYLPAPEALLMIDLTKGEILNTWNWPNPATDAGNVLLIDNVLITVSRDTLNVFYDWTGMEAWFKRQLQEKPDDVYLLQRMGQAYLKEKKYDEAASVFTQALTSAEKNPSAQPLIAPLKNYLYRTYSDWAKTAISDDVPKHLESARRYAANPQSVIEVTTQLAQYYEDLKRWDAAVNEYQYLLEQVPEEFYNTQTVWEFARRQITRLIAGAGATCYENTEQRALKFYRELKDAAEADKIRKLYQLYPNSRLAETNISHLIETSYKDGNYNQVVEFGRLFLKTYPRSAEVAPVSGKLAESYEKLQMFGTARNLLRQMERTLPAATVLTLDNKSQVISEYVRAKLAARDYQPFPASPPAELSASALKLMGHYVHKESETILVADGSGVTDVFAVSGETVIALDAAAQTKWIKKTGQELLPSTYQIGRQTIIPARRGVLAYEADPAASESRLAWFYAFKNKSETLTDAVLSETQFFLVSQDVNNPLLHHLVVIDTETGNELWSYGFKGQLTGRPLISEDTVVLPLAKDGVIILDRFDGNYLSQIKPEGEIRDCLGLPPHNLCLVGNSELWAYDLRTGNALWKYPAGALIIPNSVKTNGVQIALVRAGGNPAVPTFELVLLDATTGKPSPAVQPIVIQNYFIDNYLDGERVFVVARDKTNLSQSSVTAYDCKTGQQKWQVAVTGNLSQVLYTNRSVLINCPVYNSQDKKWLPIIRLIDIINGNEVQKITGDLQSSGMPLIRVVGANLCLIQDNAVYLYR